MSEKSKLIRILTLTVYSLLKIVKLGVSMIELNLIQKCKVWNKYELSLEFKQCNDCQSIVINIVLQYILYNNYANTCIVLVFLVELMFSLCRLIRVLSALYILFHNAYCTCKTNQNGNICIVFVFVMLMFSLSLSVFKFQLQTMP